jgi:hypothetical protein
MTCCLFLALDASGVLADRVAMDLASTVERIQQNFCICDPNLPDNPIVFASDGFLEMSQYDRFEVLGRNCRFLQVSGKGARSSRTVAASSACLNPCLHSWSEYGVHWTCLRPGSYKLFWLDRTWQ